MLRILIVVVYISFFKYNKLLSRIISNKQSYTQHHRQALIIKFEEIQKPILPPINTPDLQLLLVCYISWGRWSYQ
jgi:hypothetical protein